MSVCNCITRCVCMCMRVCLCVCNWQIVRAHFYWPFLWAYKKRVNFRTEIENHSGNSGSCRSCEADAATLPFRTSRSCSEISQKSHFFLLLLSLFSSFSSLLIATHLRPQTEEFYSHSRLAHTRIENHLISCVRARRVTFRCCYPMLDALQLH